MNATPLFDQQPLPMVTAADYEAIARSGSLGAFQARRFDQLLRFGHSPAGDTAQDVDFLPRQALSRLHDACGILHGHQEVSADRLQQALVKLEVAGALIAAAWDRLHHQPQQEGSTDHVQA